MSKKWWSLTIVFVLVMGLLAGCGEKKEGAASTAPSASEAPSAAASESPAAEKVEGSVTASGSTALQPLVTLAGDKFMGIHSEVDVKVTGGGSGTGVKNVAGGVSDIGNSDVTADDQYKDQLVDHVVAVAPFVLIVSKDVTVDDLTKQQAADIFSGKITNWKEVGGEDKAINLIHRQESSGSRKLVKKIILDGGEFATGGVTQESSKTVAQAVSQGTGAIGYVDAPYVSDQVKGLKLDGAEYTKENIASGKYILYGIEHMYTKGEPQGAVKAFLEYIMSKDFIESAEVEKMGFLPADLVKQ
ncbi:phosphate ABC transporter substrate-binding protein [Gorillibacterium timonense]|uniref:phosphate ABC transporter substrate-binding protein n=1 Tax=Gorillibacterium timonense TaxID=1689269 RepID=UPI00071DCB31|nr:phosphate ABC transporter substrate-binding protein [Gorillibacterium timonense]